MLLVQGRVFTWGCGSQGQLGHGKLEDETAPRAVTTGCFAPEVTAQTSDWVAYMRSCRIACGEFTSVCRKMHFGQENVRPSAIDRCSIFVAEK